MKKLFSLAMTAMMLLVATSASAAKTKAASKEKIVVAYVCSWTSLRLPDPTLMTHINYAFGHVNKTFDGCDVQNEPFLRQVVDLKKQNPKLKVVLSVGGWTSGNFSEMAADARCRMSFAKDCGRIVKEFGLDGIDIDWEYPTSNEAGISSSPDDTKNFTLLMRDLRKVLGKQKLLTCATIADGLYIDFPKCIKYMDFVNIMAYDVANPPKHHTTLFRSPLSGRITIEEAIDAHIRNGVPAEKLTLGMPLYGRGDHSNKTLDQFMKTGFTDGLYQEQWDEVGQVPYLTDRSGKLVWGYDNPRSIAAKCQMIIDRGLLGGMYWECTEDNAQLDLMNTVYLSLMKNQKATTPKKRVLVVTANGNIPTVKEGIDWLRHTGEEMDFDVSVLQKGDSYEKGLFDRYHLIIDLGVNIRYWGEEAIADFESYIDQAKGSFFTMPIDVNGEQWPWYGELTKTLRIADFKGATMKAGEKWVPLFWTNTDKHGRTLFYFHDDQIDKHPDMNAAFDTMRNALQWLLRM